MILEHTSCAYFSFKLRFEKTVWRVRRWYRVRLEKLIVSRLLSTDREWNRSQTELIHTTPSFLIPSYKYLVIFAVTFRNMIAFCDLFTLVCVCF